MSFALRGLIATSITLPIHSRGPVRASHRSSVTFSLQANGESRKTPVLTMGPRYNKSRAPPPPAGEPFSGTQSFRTPLGNIAPRLGLSYQPNPTTVVRLNAGMFYEATPTNTWYNPLYNNGAAGTRNFIASIAATSTPTSSQPP